MKLQKIHLPRIIIIIFLILTITGLIRLFYLKDTPGLIMLVSLVLYCSALIIYLVLLGFSFSSIGKNSPLGLFVISLIPAIVYLWYLW